MIKKMKFIFPAFMTGSLLLFFVSACSESSDAPAKSKEVRGEQQADHEHSENGLDGLSWSVEDIAAAECEHDVKTYQCDVCRYEVGVVKVPPSLLKGDAPGREGLVRTQIIAKRKVATELNVTGETQLNENAAVHISPRISGIIESVHVDIGSAVKGGDILFKITSRELGKAFGDYERNRALAALSGKNFEREKSLYERRISAEQDMIEAQMAYEQHKAEMEAARQALQVLGFTRNDLEAMTGNARSLDAGSLPVRAPMEGTIIEKHAVVGELVEPGKDVMLLADLSTVWAWADIYEQDLQQLLEAEKLGPIPVEVLVRAFPDRTFKGGIDYIGATMDEQTRTVKVRATVQNPQHLLRPGMFCEIRVAAGYSEEILAVPQTALLSDEGYDFVFIHWKEDYYIRRPVRRGREFFESVEILEGLAPGQTIVSDGAFLLKSDVLREKMGAGCAD